MIELPKFKIPKDKSGIRRIGVLTSGGDSPGMNAAIRAVVRSAIASGVEVMGIQRGYAGLLENQIHPMGASSVANIIQRGGTILRTSRCPEFTKAPGRKKAAEVLRAQGIDALVVIGGDGSYRGAYALHQEQRFPVMGLPGTIDNDINGTDDTIGFDTAINTGIELIDKIRDTASSHDRLFLVEVMGRHSGQIALHTGVGGGAETIVVPEVKTSLKEICEQVERGVRRGKTSSIIVVAEGCQFGGADALGKLLKKEGYSPRVAILGHTQRGGSPTAHDRMLASTLGAASVYALLSGKKEGMIGTDGGEVVIRSLKLAGGGARQISLAHQKLIRDLAI